MNKRNIGCGVGIAIVVLIAIISIANGGKSGSTTTTQSTPTATEAPSPTPATQTIHYPPTTEGDLRALAAKGDASAIHEFHGEGVGLATCPQPSREVTVDPSITGQSLAQDLLAYFYAQGLDNACGSLVAAYHDMHEAGDVYTAGRISLNVTGSKHRLTIDTGDLATGQQYVVNY